MLRILLITMGLGSLGATLAYWGGMPAPFLTGPALVVSVAAVAGIRCLIPIPLRNACFLMIGLGLGSGITPDVLGHAIKWPASVIAMMISVTIIMAGGAWCLRRLFGFDERTALLAATPGHMSFVLGLSLETGANVPLVSVVQALRVLMLTLLVPAAVALMTDADMSMPARVGPNLTLADLGLVALAGLGIGYAFTRLKVPAGFLLGGMVASVLGHATGFTPGIVPPRLSMVAFVTMGTLIGTRFTGITLRQVGQASLSAVFLTAGGMLVVLAITEIVVHIVDLPFASVLIGLAPGALETMIAMSAVINADPAFVGFHHIMRLFFLMALIPVMMARTKPKKTR